MELKELLGKETSCLRVEGNFMAHICWDWAGLYNENHQYDLTVLQVQRGHGGKEYVTLYDDLGEWYWKPVYENYAADVTILEKYAIAEGFTVMATAKDNWEPE